MKNQTALLATWLFLIVSLAAGAQLPANFPTVTVVTNYSPAVGEGYIFQSVNLPVEGVGYYAMILGNDGLPFWYQELTNACWDFKVLPNGRLHYAEQIHALTYTGGGDVVHRILDENYSLKETIQGGNGYAAEAHEFQLLPNGHVLLVGYYLSRVDMSQVVEGGNPAALVSGAVLQELDAQRNVVFQWRFWDHYPFTSNWVNSTAAVISEFHVNCVFEDNDANLVVSTPDWVKKINRQNGEIIWHLGGTENQFRFVGVSQEEGIRQFASHDINRLSNGNVLLYNNSRFGQAGSTSTAHEYSLDEANKIATLVWTYTPVPGVAGPFQGSAQRLANNNTFIGWGGLPGVTTPACTEVSGTNVVFQMKFDNTNVVSYRSFRFPYPPQSQAQVVQKSELASGNTYDFGVTGVSIEVQSGGGGYNQVTLTRAAYAPVDPLFQSSAPRVLPVRVSLSESAIENLAITMSFDASSFGFANPTNLTVYYRGVTGQGVFLPQPTSYNPNTRKLTVTSSLTSQANDLGEFIFCYPDLADVAFPPILNEVENDPGVQLEDVIAPRLASAGVTYVVNQETPILVSWSPVGLARSYQIQISTNEDFTTPELSIGYQNEAYLVWDKAAWNTLYFYRVKTVNDGGDSAWSQGSFRTVPPTANITSPNGGEAWQRGVKHFIRWSANIADPVLIELYKSGTLVSAIATNASGMGAYQWLIPANAALDGDYLIRISSTANPEIADLSDAPFSIVDAPVITPGSVVRLPDGRVQFGVTADGASQVTVLASTDLLTWRVLGILPLSDGSKIFTDDQATNSAAVFYRLKVP